MSHSFRLLSLFIIVSFIASCGYKSKNILFKTKKKIKSDQPVFVVAENKDSALYRHRIKPGDRLQVRFLNNYDIGQGALQSATSAANIEAGIDKGYLVNYDSSVYLPLIGRTYLTGLTRLEATQRLESLYSQFIINPIIDVNIISLSITVLGEVVTPGKILVDKENTTVVDIIALAGGLRDGGKKNNVKIIRNNEIIVVNLKKIDVLKSPDIILHDNDIVYVEPYGVKAALEPVVSIGNALQLLLTVTQLTIFSLQIYAFTR